MSTEFECSSYDEIVDDLYLKRDKRKKKGKNKKKKRDEEDKEIIKMLGGKDKVKKMGAAMVEYAETYKRFIILSGTNPDQFSKEVDECIKMLKDLEKGKTYMLDYDAVREYCQELEDSQGCD